MKQLEPWDGDVLVSSIVHDVDGSNLLAVHLVAVHRVVTTIHAVSYTHLTLPTKRIV